MNSVYEIYKILEIKVFSEFTSLIVTSNVPHMNCASQSTAKHRGKQLEK